MKKLLSLLLIICSIGVAYADDKSTVTSLKYVTDELNTRQDKFGANDGKAMTFTNAAGGNLPRDVKESLGTSTTDNGLPTVSAVNTGLENKQDEIGAANTNTVVTYTGTPGTLGQKGIYQDTGTYATQSDNLIDARTFNAALRNGLENEFVCADRDPVSNQCWLWTIHNNGDLELPSEYTRLEYIESTGTQYINTGINGLNTGNWEIYAKWMVTDTPTANYPYIVGAYSAETVNAYRVILKLKETEAYYVSGNSKAGGGSVLISNKPANMIHTATINNGYVVFDGVSYNTPTQGTTIPASVSINLFKSGLKGRIYASYAKKDGVYKYNYIPAKRNSDDAIGMYDTVSGTFKENSGTGTFTTGSTATGGISYTTLVPAGYTPLEYIESTGTQYIDTGVVPTLQTGALLKVALNQLKTSDNVIFGATNQNAYANGAALSVDIFNNYVLFPHGSLEGGSCPTNKIIKTMAANKVYNFGVNYQGNGLATLDDSVLSLVPTVNMTSKSLYLFNLNTSSGGVSQYATRGARFYDVIFTEGREVSHHYIPARRNSDNVVGMYDTVSNTFKTNAGTGTFTAGPDVSNAVYIPQDQN